MKGRILIVDDEPGILASLSGVLADEGYETVCTRSGAEALELYRERPPDAVFLDIWLPDRDGLETLEAILELDPEAAVVMMSGHGTPATAARAVKMGAFDYVEKPLSYDQAVEVVAAAVTMRRGGTPPERPRWERDEDFRAPAPLRITAEGGEPQRTLRESTVLYGLGLHSGTRTGMVLQPLPPDSGIHFITLPSGSHIPAHVSSVTETDYATTLHGGGDRIRTVEHLLSALHAYGIINLLVKVHGEIPVLDGSALEFCRAFDEVGVEEQDRRRRDLVIDRGYRVGEGEKSLTLEPGDGFAVSYLLRYPAPVGEQRYEFELAGVDAYKEQIAPARTFGFMRDLTMIQELGLGSGGRLDNFILVGEDDVLNTELRFPDEFVRHKILDIIGDLYLLGYPVRGRVTARLTGHRDNIAILRKLVAEAA
ncbi:MAG: UDP-3-O-acyl-N-acetylglucosamine deacetylase [Thermoanaerobaculia bacterium]